MEQNQVLSSWRLGIVSVTAVTVSLLAACSAEPTTGAEIDQITVGTQFGPKEVDALKIVQVSLRPPRSNEQIIQVYLTVLAWNHIAGPAQPIYDDFAYLFQNHIPDFEYASVETVSWAYDREHFDTVDELLKNGDSITYRYEKFQPDSIDREQATQSPWSFVYTFGNRQDRTVYCVVIASNDQSEHSRCMDNIEKLEAKEPA